MFDKNHHTLASSALLQSSWGTDSKVSEAIRKLVSMSSPSHTIKSRKFSLPKLLETHIDLVVTEWLCRNDFRPTWKFSKLVLTPHSSVLQLLNNLHRHGSQVEDSQPDEFEATCNCLIELLYFCHSHSSKNIKVVLTEPQKNGSFDEHNVRFGKGIQHGARAKNKKSNVHPYLNSVRKKLKADGFCIACGMPTLAMDERDRLVSKAVIEKPIKDALKLGVQYANKERASLDYCFEHAEGIAGSAAAHKARYWQISFWSLLYAMRRKGVAHELNTLFPPSFDLEFARLAIQNKRCQIYITRIKQNINSILTKKDSDHINEVKVILLSIKKMFFEILKLKPNPYTPPIYSIVDGFHHEVQHGLMTDKTPYAGF